MSDASNLDSGGMAPDPAPELGILAEPPAARPAPPPRTKRPVLTLILAGSLTAVLAFAGGVLVGRTTAGTNASGDNSQRPGAPFASGGPGNRFAPGTDGEMPEDFPSGAPDGTVPRGGAGPNATAGSVTAIDGQSITIETEDGETYEIQVGADTSVSVSGDVTDLQEGDEITVTGTPDADGVILNPPSIIQGGFGGVFGQGVER
jgi:hypothetical protein